jgi:uncharacterized protein YndB with AHSA1/START domain
MGEEVTVTEEISASPDRVWSMVADLPRMGEWSPENEGATWLRGASGPKPGALFQGRNRNGRKTWKTTGRIVASEPGRRLCFCITVAGIKISEWRYLFEPTLDGCRVTETWIDLRGAIPKALGKSVSGVGDRVSHNRDTMERTLKRLKVAAELPES